MHTFFKQQKYAGGNLIREMRERVRSFKNKEDMKNNGIQFNCKKNCERRCPTKILFSKSDLFDFYPNEAVKENDIFDIETPIIIVGPITLVCDCHGFKTKNNPTIINSQSDCGFFNYAMYLCGYDTIEKKFYLLDQKNLVLLQESKIRNILGKSVPLFEDSILFKDKHLLKMKFECPISVILDLKESTWQSDPTNLLNASGFRWLGNLKSEAEIRLKYNHIEYLQEKNSLGEQEIKTYLTKKGKAPKMGDKKRSYDEAIKNKTDTEETIKKQKKDLRNYQIARCQPFMIRNFLLSIDFFKKMPIDIFNIIVEYLIVHPLPDNEN